MQIRRGGSEGKRGVALHYGDKRDSSKRGGENWSLLYCPKKATLREEEKKFSLTRVVCIVEKVSLRAAGPIKGEDLSCIIEKSNTWIPQEGRK